MVFFYTVVNRVLHCLLEDQKGRDVLQPFLSLVVAFRPFHLNIISTFIV